jgi:peptidoglycan/xylan/chitin deacetylase (PgdA/CDA1 family)
MMSRVLRYVVTLSFDDGFERSSLRTAELFERFGLAAEINVVARGHLGEPKESWHARFPKGDFALWNELQARGHVVQPHGLVHANKAELPLAEAQSSIEQCLEVFRNELDGFDAARTVFVFPYNASTPELEAWLPTVVRAFRTAADPFMPFPRAGQTKVGCTSFGPGPCDDALEHHVDQLFARESGWLCFNTHGLDGEGWGPLSSATLERVLARLVERDDTAVLPIGAVLDLASS